MKNMNPEPRSVTDSKKTEPAYRQFLKELGVTKAQSEYQADKEKYPQLTPGDDGTYETDEVDMGEIPDEVLARPIRLSFKPVPEANGLWYTLDLLTNEISVVEDGDEGLVRGNPQRELTIKAKDLQAEAKNFERFRLLHERITEAGARYGYKMRN